MIRLIDIQKTYDNGTKALKGVNLRIDDGEFAFLVGPSGSGKSTIIKLLTAEVAPSGGRIMVNGYNLGSIRQKQIPFMRRTLGVIFQDFRLIDKKTVRENLEFAMRAVGASPREIRKRIPYVLDLVGLSRKEDRYPTQISGGEQQRIAIARVMLKNAPILILDEATAFADPENEALVQRAFEKLSKGKTVIMIAHRLTTIRNARRIFVLREGHVEESGTHDALLAQGGLYAKMWQDYQTSVSWKVGAAK